MKRIVFALLLGFVCLLGVATVAAQTSQFPQDFGALATDTYNAEGVWSDGETLWVANSDTLYAYSMQTKARVTDKDIDTLSGHRSRGIWSNGVTMWVTNFNDNVIYAYNLQTETRDESKDFNTLDAAGNDHPEGIWSNGAIMWAVDRHNDKIYAYDMESKARVESEDFNTLPTDGNPHPHGIWSNGETMWVVDFHHRQVYAYSMQSKERDATRDFTPHGGPTGIWSDGKTMWVSDFNMNKLYAYNLTTKARETRHRFNIATDTPIVDEAENAHAEFTVSAPLSLAADTTVKMRLSQTGDYVAAGETRVTVVSGASSATSTAAINNDNTDEPNGDVVAALVEDDAHYLLGLPVAATVAIRDDDPEPTITGANVAAPEGEPLRFIFHLSNPSDYTVKIDYNTSDGTADAGEDYRSASGTVTFLPGRVTATMPSPAPSPAPGR